MQRTAHGPHDTRAATPSGWGRDARRIEEYARHNGHADLLREAVEGEVGEEREVRGLACRRDGA